MTTKITDEEYLRSVRKSLLSMLVGFGKHAGFEIPNDLIEATEYLLERGFITSDEAEKMRILATSTNIKQVEAATATIIDIGNRLYALA